MGTFLTLGLTAAQALISSIKISEQASGKKGPEKQNFALALASEFMHFGGGFGQNSAGSSPALISQILGSPRTLGAFRNFIDAYVALQNAIRDESKTA